MLPMGDYNPVNYQVDPNDFSTGGMRQDFALDDLNFDPAYMMDNNCTDDLAVSSRPDSEESKILHYPKTVVPQYPAIKFWPKWADIQLARYYGRLDIKVRADIKTVIYENWQKPCFSIRSVCVNVPIKL